MNRNFRALLEAQWDQKKFLCVGLDSDFEKLPEHLKEGGVYESIFAFNRAIVDATKDIAGSYKPNTAFYEAHGDRGIAALRDSIAYINEAAPDAPVILDAKRADIGNTNNGYVDFAYHYIHADAITVHPYLGAEALAPFFDQKDKGVFVLCRTSNPGAGEFQDLESQGMPLYMHVAKKACGDWNRAGNCGIVVGATYPKEMQEIRSEVGDLTFLIPGVGAQGADLSAAVQAGKDSTGRGMIINAGRSVIFASNGTDFAEAARSSAQALHEAIQNAL